MKEGFEQIPSTEAEPEFHSPFSEVTLKEFGAEFPEKKDALETVLDEINKQGIENFNVFRTETLPGVAFSYTKMSVTPELIRKLSAMNESPELGTPREDPAEVAPEKEAVDAEENTKGREEKRTPSARTGFSLPRSRRRPTDTRLRLKTLP